MDLLLFDSLMLNVFLNHFSIQTETFEKPHSPLILRNLSNFSKNRSGNLINDTKNLGKPPIIWPKAGKSRPN